MREKMTPCEKLGYKVGDEFEVISHHAFKNGQVVTLHEDDGTECPLFAGDGGGAGVFDGVECSFATLNQHVRKIANKLKLAKQALADAIHKNGGWPEWAEWSCQINRSVPKVVFSRKTKKPYRRNGWGGWSADSGILEGGFLTDKKINNWHQCVLSREEYYQAYPVADADGWIEWMGGECPVGDVVLIDVKKVDGSTELAVHDPQDRIWSDLDHRKCITAYRLHKQEVKPEFCESVTHGIPEPESIDGLCAKVTEENKHQHIDAKPTIEQLVQDYRNMLDFANSKQKEADEAKAAADAALGELERAGEALGLLIGIAKPDREPELVITDWRDLKVGDVVEITGSSNNCWKDHSGREMTVKDVYPEQGDNDDQVDLIGESGAWCLGGNTTWRFIRRP